jgi:hypothetical protein
MSTLYITEYAGLTDLPVGKQGPVPLEPPLAEQNISFTGTAGTSAAFNASTRVIRVTVDGIASVLVSAAGAAATTASGRMAVGVVEYRGVPMWQGYKISAITNT